jgi:A/G-specific adenine glycosylase
VLRLWEGLGYPRRAKYLHQAAQLLAPQLEATQEGFPRTLDALLALPGVGEYTARAVLAFAFETDVAVVDTNTARLLARWANRTMNRSEVQAAADAALPDGEGWAWNQAMLDLGALVCTRTAPNCDRCPVATMCAYRLAVTGSEVSPADPATGTAGVSLPQIRFAGSDRQFRGRVLRLAAQGSRVEEVAALVGLGHDSERASRLIQSLVTDGLMELVEGRVKLPGNEARESPGRVTP